MNTKLLEWKDDLTWKRNKSQAIGLNFDYRIEEKMESARELCGGGNYYFESSLWIAGNSHPSWFVKSTDLINAKACCQSHHEAILAEVEESKKEAYSDGFDAGFKSARETFEKSEWISVSDRRGNAPATTPTHSDGK